MNSQRFSCLSAAALTAAIAIAQHARAQTSSPSATPDPTQEIQALRARLDQLEATQKDQERQRHEAETKLDEKITADELNKEATAKSQFLTAEGFTAGYSDADHRFVIQSDNGDFKLRPFLHLQFRGVSNDREGFQGIPRSPEDEWNSGFEIRRMKFGFDGNAFSPDLEYNFIWATQRTSSSINVTGSTGATKGTTIGTVSNNLGGVPILEEAWIKYHFPSTPLSLWTGQIKDPVLHDQIVGTRAQVSAERSLLADVFVNGDGYTEGGTLIFQPIDPLRTQLGINHGLRSINTNFLSYPNNGSLNSFDYGIVGRAEYKAFGQWRDYSTLGSVDKHEDLLVFGIGSDYSERGHDGQLVVAADATYEFKSGLSLYGAFVDRYTPHNFGFYTQSTASVSLAAGDPAVTGHPTNEYGLAGQVAYLIPNTKIEPFGRWEYLSVKGTPAGSRNYVNDFVGGVNYYFHGRNVKLTGEVLYLPQGLPFNDTASDQLINNGKGEIVYEVQLELEI